MLHTNSQTILTDWREHYAALFGKQTLCLRHNLHKSDLFSDGALAALIEGAAREDYHVNFMDDGVRREGEFGDLSGAEVLEAVKSGKIWINLKAPARSNPAYGDLMNQMFAEFEARVEGLETFRQRMTILISSPNMRVKYHMDVPGQSLWQVRGTKKVFIYPAAEPFLPQPAIENLVLGEAHETDTKYEQWFDDFAQEKDLEPGEMLHWPLNGPHRVDNHNCLNVSVTTEHWTKALRRIYAVNYANGLMRKMGMKHLPRAVSGPGLWGRMALAGAVKMSGIRKSAAKPYKIDFQVDPDSSDSVRPIDGYEMRL